MSTCLRLSSFIQAPSVPPAVQRRPALLPQSRQDTTKAKKRLQRNSASSPRLSEDQLQGLLHSNRHQLQGLDALPRKVHQPKPTHRPAAPTAKQPAPAKQPIILQQQETTLQPKQKALSEEDRLRALLIAVCEQCGVTEHAHPVSAADKFLLVAAISTSLVTR